MNRLFNFFAILAVMTISALCSAQDASVRRDGKAIEILKSMDAYLGSLDSAMISGVYGLLLFCKHFVRLRQGTTAYVYPVSLMMPFS